MLVCHNVHISAIITNAVTRFLLFDADVEKLNVGWLLTLFKPNFGFQFTFLRFSAVVEDFHFVL